MTSPSTTDGTSQQRYCGEPTLLKTMNPRTKASESVGNSVAYRTPRVTAHTPRPATTSIATTSAGVIAAITGSI